MKQTRMKKVLLSLTAVVALTLITGSMTPSFAQWGWGRGNGRDRYEERNRRSRDRDYDDYRNRRDRRDDYGYGDYGRNGGFRNREQEKGYRDGLDRGQKDYQTNRIGDPNNSSHYRKGNADYRVGFRQGYRDGYGSRSSRNRGWW